MNSQWLIQALGVTVAILAMVTAMLYWCIVCVTLYQHGARFPTGLKPWQYFRDLRDYKGILLAEAHTPTWYHLIVFLTWVTLAMLLTLVITAWHQHLESSSLHQRRRY